MNEIMEAKAAELDPSRTKTIGSYVIGTPPTTQARPSARAPSAKSSPPSTSPPAKR